MDLGLEGKKAIVCASSRGLGRACAEALGREGARVVINGVNPATLEKTANELCKSGIAVEAVCADVTTEEGRRQLLAVLPEPDILINNAGGPPAGNFRNWTRDDWIKALDANMLSAIELMKRTIDPMIKRRFGRIVNITSGAVKAPFPYLGLSNGARSGLTGFVAGLAREVSQHNVTINNLLPGSFATDRLTETARAVAGPLGISVEAQLEQWQEGEASKRFGTPAEFGDACAFLCSSQAGYITGQNLLLDGGTYPGTF
ncbi:MAG: SDR family oxidoreductase [Rhizobiales bacterium]|nr:SDR family oxidoreductase [Hyphomicrobiales bacterium]